MSTSTASYHPPYGLQEVSLGQKVTVTPYDTAPNPAEFTGEVVAIGESCATIRNAATSISYNFDDVADVAIELPADEVEYLRLCDDLDACREAYSENYAQHRSETALYGDSWPGAQIQLREVSNTISELEARYNAHPRTVAARAAEAHARWLAAEAASDPNKAPWPTEPF